MDKELEQKLNETVWAAHTLFARGSATGSAANISVRHGDLIYISASGTCFGTLKPEDLIPVDLNGTSLTGRKPSKELPLHLALYRKDPSCGGVIHTHSTYAILWSFVPAPDETDVMPDHTPYLRMKAGSVGFVPYEKPGTRELFEAFDACVQNSDAFILKQHGPIVPGKTIMDAFYAIEELEESAKIAWELYRLTGSRS